MSSKSPDENTSYPWHSKVLDDFKNLTIDDPSPASSNSVPIIMLDLHWRSPNLATQFLQYPMESLPPEPKIYLHPSNAKLIEVMRNHRPNLAYFELENYDSVWGDDSIESLQIEPFTNIVCFPHNPKLEHFR